MNGGVDSVGGRDVGASNRSSNRGAFGNSGGYSGSRASASSSRGSSSFGGSRGGGARGGGGRRR